MGRLEDIAERNRNPKGHRERMVWGMVIGLFIVFILILMVFTNLGKRPDPKRSPPSKDHHVDDVPLKAPRPKAAR